MLRALLFQDLDSNQRTLPPAQQHLRACQAKLLTACATRAYVKRSRHAAFKRLVLIALMVQTGPTKHLLS